tara:strand:- start:303 stop:740 length:438 start_codon:yes stop_codon:yes gene_type:complete
MKKLFLLSFLLLLFIGCTSTSNDISSVHSDNMSLLSDIIEQHDEVMKKMSTINSLENDLSNKEVIDSNIDLAIQNLKESNMSMMNFMKNFSDQFPYDSYPMNKKVEDKNLDFYKDINEKLNLKKDKILKIGKQFEESIAKAEELI